MEEPSKQLGSRTLHTVTALALTPTGLVIATHRLAVLRGRAVDVRLSAVPDGRLPSPRWRPVAWALGLAIGLFTASVAFMPGPMDPGLGDRVPRTRWDRPGPGRC